MKGKINYLRSSLNVNVIGAITVHMLVFGLLFLVIGNSICYNGIKHEHGESTYRMADAASALVYGDYIDLFLEGNNKLEYARMKRELDLCCKKMHVTLIYVIAVDTSDYGSFVSVINCVNNTVDDTNYVEWPLGHRRMTTNEEYRQKYIALYEQGSAHEIVYRMDPEDGSKPHITAMVPIKDSSDKVVALLCMQRPTSELINMMMPYIFTILGGTLTLVVLSIIIVSIFIKKAIINPVNKVSREATRFAAQNTKGEPLGKISRYKVFDDLSESIDDMETELTEYIENLTAVTAEKERMGAELDIARRIQTGMIPSVFPPFPDRHEFDIYASMTTAKEVGGDFYNFFFIDDDRLALVIADVSGKGVPAALFMMVTSILISERMRTGSYSPAEVLSEVNNKVCSRNRAGLFVTVWLGILEVSTGRIVCANAGHDDPVVCRKNGEFELVKSRHGLVLGTIEEIQYKDLEFTLNSGDKLFLFTDGIPDAKNAAGKRFKIDGMLSALNLHRNKTPQGIIKGVKESVDAFVGDAPQFDDITMLCLEMNGSVVRKSLTTEAVLDQLDEVKGLVNSVLDEVGCPKKIRKKITLSVEEVFVNIANYAYGSDGGTVSVEVEGSCTGVAITFRDSGVPYDPLKKPDPDVTLSVDQRQIGGLGVYLVKKNMDTLSYSYIDNQNVLTITKYFSA